MQLTFEQQTILSHVQSNTGITLVNSVAGSGKTTLLTSIAKAIPHDNGLYICYNNAIAKESKTKFPATTACSTIHSLAYRAVVPVYKLLVTDFTHRSITERLDYGVKVQIVDSIREFCLSSHTDYDKFCTDKDIRKYGIKYLDLMANGKIDCSHDFYLKFFHILLSSGDITYEPFDFILLDEAGDVNPVTAAIFELLPSERKVAVGDQFQNIYSFNHTINYFKTAPSTAVTFDMTQSFRVSNQIAPLIEQFCRSYMDPKASFKGVSVPNAIIKSTAIITRTNAALIDYMIQLNEQGTPYGLVRPPKEIFRIPLMLCSMKYQSFISDPTYRHLQEHVDDWHEGTNIREAYKSPIMYIASLYPGDFQLQQAIRLIVKHGKPLIWDTYNLASAHYNYSQDIMLMTAHSSKGLEFDHVIIANDLNESISQVLTDVKSGVPIANIPNQQVEPLRLYYVACSRAKVKLSNANQL